MQCPNCKSKTDFLTEKRMNGYTICMICSHKAPTARFQYDAVNEALSATKITEQSEFDKQFEDMMHKAVESIPEPVHPLLNPDSQHYQMFDGVEAIERLEEMFSKEELAIWAKITSFKYRLRIGKKDDVQKEITKILGYEAYYGYLKNEE